MFAKKYFIIGSFHHPCCTGLQPARGRSTQTQTPVPSATSTRGGIIILTPILIFKSPTPIIIIPIFTLDFSP